MSEPRILVIEDEPDLLRGLALNLRAEGYIVLTASRGDTAVEQALRERPELVLLDIMLPGMNGLDVCRELRRKGFEAPIIMLTAKVEELDRVVGLEIGADDYVTKPFGIRELLARIRARLRRHAPIRESESKLHFEEVEVDFTRQEALRAGKRIELTGKNLRSCGCWRGTAGKSSRASACWKRSGDTNPTRPLAPWITTFFDCGRSWRKIRLARAISFQSTVRAISLWNDKTMRDKELPCDDTWKSALPHTGLRGETP
jgi:CheY-like chemotaxis protein